ncbi:MAG: hypothetical protein AB9880_05690 [Christensenellales bacterium]
MRRAAALCLTLLLLIAAVAQAAGIPLLTLRAEDSVADQALALGDYISQLSPADQQQWHEQIAAMAAEYEKQALSQAAEDEGVYMTRSGSVYHRASCRHVFGKADLVRLSPADAQARGIKACKVCFK